MDADFGWSRLRSVKCEERCDEAQETRQSQRHTRSTHQTPVTWPCFARDIGSFPQSSSSGVYVISCVGITCTMTIYGNMVTITYRESWTIAAAGVCMGTSYSMR